MTADCATLFAEGQRLHRAGQLAEAKARYDQVLAAAPRHGGAIHMLGLIAYQAGQNDVAATLLEQAVHADPLVPSAHSNLGLALKALGRFADAAASFRRALALAPQSAEAHNNLGLALLEQGKPEAASESFARATALNPALAEAHANLGDALWGRGLLAEAQASHRRALALKPGDAATLTSLAVLARAQGECANALACIHQALLREETPRARRIFADIAAAMRWETDDVAMAVLLTRAIDQAWGRPADLAAAAASLVRLHLADGTRLEDDALLRALLRATPNSDLELEALLTAARRRLLQTESGHADFAAALAQQCFLNEYVFVQDAEESLGAEQLRRRAETMLAAGEQPPEALLLALACYVPLGALANAERIGAANPRLAGLLAQQRDAPAEEKRLAAAIPRLTPIADNVSRAVQGQYEENPYPRWSRLIAPVAPLPLGRYLASRFGFVDTGIAEKPMVLAAGCGTGQYALEMARQFPLGGMLAMDLSRASLGHAARKAAEAGVTGVRFGQGDILAAAALAESFDVIECGGVLHHLADPFAGWQALLGQLKPGGLMRLAFYSATARRTVAQARAWIAREGFAATPDGIRACRAGILADGRAGPLGALLDSPEFYSISMCRDLLFHVQERPVTLEEIAAFLSRHELELLGFEAGDSVRAAYRTRFPGDPAARDLGHWAQFEADNPDTFAAMYQFWVHRKPCA